MNILFKREQSNAAFSLVPLRIGSGVIFKLHAELELDEDENELVKQYKLSQVALVLSDPMEDLKRAFRPAMIVAFLAFLFFYLLGGFGTAFFMGFVIFLIMSVVYFKAMREQILLSHLLDGGRTFQCDSVVELIQKEAYLETVCSYLRQVLESAKHWDDRESIPIMPLPKEAAKAAVLKGSHG